MATNYEHTHPISSSECDRRTLLANAANPLATQMASTEVHCSTDGAGRIRFFRANQNIGRTYFLGDVANEAAMLALDQAGLAQGACLPGDYCHRSDTGQRMVCLNGYGTTADAWAVDASIAALTTGLAMLDTHLDEHVAALEIELSGKIGSSALDGYAPLASPALTGTPTAPTPTTASGIATKGWVESVAGASVGASSPAYKIVATGGHLELADATCATGDAGAITIACWIRSSSSGCNFQSIARCGAGFHWILRSDMGNPSFYLNISGSFYKVTGGSSWLDNRWHHIAARSGGTAATMQIHVDGVVVATGGSAQAAMTPDAHPLLVIGDGDGTGAEQMYGQIRDVAVWDESLSDGNLLALLGGFAPDAITPAPTAYWRLLATPAGEGGTPDLSEVGFGTALLATYAARVSPPT